MQLSFYSNFTSTLAAQETRINALQQQISTGLKVQTPDQDPAAYETAALGNDQISQLDNDNTAQASIQGQLNAANNAYSSLASLLDNVQSTILQALNGTSSSDNLNAMATQLKSDSQQLLSIGNAVGPNGNYLFGGSRGNVTPFQTNANGEIAYYGDAAQSQATIGKGETANTLVNGEVFTSPLSGSGISYVSAAASNNGTGQILQQGVVSAAAANAFQQGSSAITVSFAISGGSTTYSATQNGTEIASGTLNNDGTEQSSLQLDGVNYEITGSPADGDSFTISPSRPQTAFALFSQIEDALTHAGTTPAQIAQTNQVLNQSLASLEELQQNVTTAQAQNGVTLQALTNAAAGNTNQKTAAQTIVQNATAADLPTAITALDNTMTALEAAMKTFGAVQNLSLFNYL